MYIFPKNTKFVLCTILLSALYLFVAISSSIRYIDNKVEMSKIEVKRKVLAIEREGNILNTSRYYDVVKDAPYYIYLPMEQISTPWGYDDTEEYYWILPSYNPDGNYIQRDRVPWIVECNEVYGSDYDGWEFKKIHIYPIAIGFKKHIHYSDKQEAARRALRNVLNDYRNIRSYNNSPFVFNANSQGFTTTHVKNRYHMTEVYQDKGGFFYEKIQEEEISLITDSLYVDYSFRDTGIHDFVFGHASNDCVVYLQRIDHNVIFKIRHLPHKVAQDKAMCICASVLSWIILLFITIGIYKKFRQKEIAKIQKPLYERLYDACNPKLFLKPYDQQKVLLAGEIRKQISLHKDSEEAIHELYMKAKNELGINVLDSHRLDQLEKLVNPSHFMQQGNEQNFLLANELYAKLKNRDTLLYNDYLVIEQEATRLYQPTE